MKDLKCQCGDHLEYKDGYRCRICHDWFCQKCSLEHFGLYETGGQVQYKNIFRTMYWLIRKRIFGR
jgi:hypothetical protein